MRCESLIARARPDAGRKKILIERVQRDRRRGDARNCFDADGAFARKGAAALLQFKPGLSRS